MMFACREASKQGYFVGKSVSKFISVHISAFCIQTTRYRQIQRPPQAQDLGRPWNCMSMLRLISLLGQSERAAGSHSIAVRGRDGHVHLHALHRGIGHPARLAGCLPEACGPGPVIGASCLSCFRHECHSGRPCRRNITHTFLHGRVA